MSLFAGLGALAGSLIGGNKSSKGAERAAQIQADATREGIAAEERMFNQSRQDFEPFRELGVGAIDPLSALLGIGGPEAQLAAINDLQASPLYESLYRNGEEAILQNASATGGLRGGNTQLGLAEFGRDTLSSVIQQQIGNLGGVVGIGTGATGAVANLGANSVAARNNLRNQGAGAQASSVLTSAGVGAQNAQNIGSGLGELLQRIFNKVDL